MNVTYELLRQLDRAYGSSYYLLKNKDFKTNISEFRNAFRARYQNSNLGYSYKTNYIPAVCKIAHELGAYSEIVSGLELRIAQRLNVPGGKIIYNGPAKSVDSLEYCMLNKAKVNIDHLSELEQIRAIAAKYPQQKFKLGIRINIEMDDFFSRFGFDPRTNAFEYAIHVIRSQPSHRIVII